jgi:CheY-like chemotaxis protein
MTDEIQKKRILIVEDDVFLGDILTQKLLHEGYDVHLIRDGGEALQEMVTMRPDLILLDIVLPTMSGYEILEKRRTNPEIANIPVIIISNSGQPVEINRVLSLGVKDYLIKAQLDPQQVIEKIRPYFSASATGGTHEGRLKNKKILWVEDDSFLSDLLANKLTHEGCTSLYAKDGEQALTMLEQEHPDVILLDLILPGMSGFDVLKKIKENDATKTIPVIVLSNLGQDQDREKSKSLGATLHLVKAEHDIDDLINQIQTVIT